MKIVIAPNSFKGSFTSIEAASIFSEALKTIRAGDEIIECPLGDGGDGTLDIFARLCRGEKEVFTIPSNGNKQIKAPILFLLGNKAYIEIAKADGLNQKSNDPLYSSSYGVGALISIALKRGSKEIILGLGGSASTDGGTGMAAALGFSFYGRDEKKLSMCGKTLNEIERIEKPIELPSFSLKMLSDVNNPLFGKRGAAYVYGPQKGVTSKVIPFLDMGLRHLSSFFLDVDTSFPGAGAAGGIGYGGKAFFNGEIMSGAQAILDSPKVIEAFSGADIIITGEGAVDKTSFEGKVLGELIKRKGHSQVFLIAGSSSLSKEELKERGISKIAYCQLFEDDKGFLKAKDSLVKAVSSLFNN